MLPTSAGVEHATSWSPVGRRIHLSHRGPVQRVMDMVDVLKFHTPKFLTIWHRQTLQAQIMKEQSDQGLYCLPFPPALVAQFDAPSNWKPGGCGFSLGRGWQHSFMEIDHEIISTISLSLLLIQERQLSVSGECAQYWLTT